MTRLARRRVFCRKFDVEFVDGDWPHLTVENPLGVVRIVGEAKRAEYSGRHRVVIRGQTANHKAMRPGLFRNQSADTACLHSAEKEFARKIRERIPAARFAVPSLPALLQHYGFRTSWLDAVDNLFVACWFANHEISVEAGHSLRICAAEASHGWLFLLRLPTHVRVMDLRAEHHPLSMRPHVQHGVSIEPPGRLDPDLRDLVVTTVRTPVAGLTSGGMFTSQYLFPPTSVDHTLRLLVKHQVSELAASVATEHGLAPDALGQASRRHVDAA